jgi:hypothetical protein
MMEQIHEVLEMSCVQEGKLFVDMFHWFTIHTIMTPSRSHPWAYTHEFACSPHEG